MVNIIKNFNWCSSHLYRLFLMLGCYNFHQKKTWLIMTIPCMQRRLFHSPNILRSLLNLFNVAYSSNHILPLLTVTREGESLCKTKSRRMSCARSLFSITPAIGVYLSHNQIIHCSVHRETVDQPIGSFVHNHNHCLI